MRLRKTARALVVAVPAILAALLAFGCVDDGNDTTAPTAGGSESSTATAEVLRQYRTAVNAEDLVAIEALLDADVVQTTFTYHLGSVEHEHFGIDLVDRDAVLRNHELLGPQASTSMPKEAAVVKSPVITHVEGATIIQSEIATVMPLDDPPSAEESAATLSAIYVAHDMEAPAGVDDYRFYSTATECSPDAVESNDPGVLRAQFAAVATEDEPEWQVAAYSLTVVRSYCPNRFNTYAAVVRDALGDVDADRAIEWDTVPIS